MQRRKRVVSDLWPRVGDRCDQGRLSGVGHAQQADVSQHAKLQAQAALLPRPTRCLLAWRAVGTALVVHVAEPAVTPFGYDQPFTGLKQLRQHGVGGQICDDRSHWQAKFDVVPSGTELIRSPSWLATPGFVTPGVAVVDQRVQAGIGHRDHVAATAAVTAIRPTQGNVLFTPKTRAPRASVARSNVDHHLVDELHGMSRGTRNEKAPACRGFICRFGTMGVIRTARPSQSVAAAGL